MEARTHRRYRVWLPVRISGETLEASFAVSRDASEGGLLMSAVEPLEVGARVELQFAVPTMDDRPVEEHHLAATIVRVEPNRDDPDGAFPHRVAVKFDAPVPGLEASLTVIADELARPK